MKMPYDKASSHASSNSVSSNRGSSNSVSANTTSAHEVPPHLARHPASSHLRIPHLVTAAGLAGCAILLGVLLSQVSGWLSWTQSQNSVQLPDGKARLGQVYREQLVSTLHVQRVADNTVLLHIEASPVDLYPKAVEQTLQDIRHINDQARASQGDSFTPVRYESAMWSDDIRVQVRTEVIYTSQYQQNLRVPIQSQDTIVKKNDASISKLLEGLKDYGARTTTLYQQQYSFIPAR